MDQLFSDCLSSISSLQVFNRILYTLNLTHDHLLLTVQLLKNFKLPCSLTHVTKQVWGCQVCETKVSIQSKRTMTSECNFELKDPLIDALCIMQMALWFQNRFKYSYVQCTYSAYQPSSSWLPPRPDTSECSSRLGSKAARTIQSRSIVECRDPLESSQASSLNDELPCDLNVNDDNHIHSLRKFIYYLLKTCTQYS